MAEMLVLVVFSFFNNPIQFLLDSNSPIIVCKRSSKLRAESKSSSALCLSAISINLTFKKKTNIKILQISFNNNLNHWIQKPWKNPFSKGFN